jgi:hypothetical protein
LSAVATLESLKSLQFNEVTEDEFEIRVPGLPTVRFSQCVGVNIDRVNVHCDVGQEASKRAMAAVDVQCSFDPRGKLREQELVIVTVLIPRETHSYYNLHKVKAERECWLTFNNGVMEQGYRALRELHFAYYYQGIGQLGPGIVGSRITRVPTGGYFVQARYPLTGETIRDRGRAAHLRSVLDPIAGLFLIRGTPVSVLVGDEHILNWKLLEQARRLAEVGRQDVGRVAGNPL